MAGKKRAGGKAAQPEGQLRQSQLVTTFGPGAMVDLVDRAVVIGGLEHWGFGREGFEAVDDERLRRSLVRKLKELDPDLDLAQEGYFRRPPVGDLRDPHPSVGVRVLEFPRWFVCQGCRRLARAQDAFENKGGRYRHECSRGKAARAVPVRFVAACQRGHLGDFPWLHFTHHEREGGECERPELYLYEPSVGDISQIRVECKTCGASQPLSRARGAKYPCSGDRPWLGGKAAREPCGLYSELLVRTASHAYFGQIVSALRLPLREPDPLRERLQERDVWRAVQKVTNVAELTMLNRMAWRARSLGSSPPRWSPPSRRSGTAPRTMTPARCARPSSSAWSQRPWRRPGSSRSRARSSRPTGSRRRRRSSRRGSAAWWWCRSSARCGCR